jgi:putative sterol carrier protein
MADMYNAAVIPGLRVTIQLHFVDSGEHPDWFVAIDDDTCKARRGTTPFPTLRVYTPTKVWESIGRGQVDAVQAFTDGAFEVDGQLELLSLLPRVLTYPR